MFWLINLVNRKNVFDCGNIRKRLFKDIFVLNERVSSRHKKIVALEIFYLIQQKKYYT